MAAQMAQQQQHNDGQNASSSQLNIPGSYEHSQVIPSGAHDKQVSHPVLDVDSRLIPSASISDRNDIDISTGTQNGHGGDCIPKVAGLVDQKGQVTNQSTEPPDETQGRNFSSTSGSSSQAGEEDEATLAASTHLSVDAVGLASSPAAFEKNVLPAASLVSQSLQPYAQRTTDRDQVLEQFLLENAPVSDQNVDWAGDDAGGIVPVNVIQQSDFDQDDIDVARGHVGIVPANAIQQPEILEFDHDGNDGIDLAQARAERNHDAQASAGRRRQYFMNANGDIDIVLARQEWIFGHMCLSCRENNRKVTMVPCGHSVLCWRCFLESSVFHEQISRCPRCMQPTLGIKLSQDCLRRVLQSSQQE